MTARAWAIGLLLVGTVLGVLLVALRGLQLWLIRRLEDQGRDGL